jgi:hypothetical protein
MTLVELHDQDAIAAFLRQSPERNLSQLLRGAHDQRRAGCMRKLPFH